MLGQAEHGLAVELGGPVRVGVRMHAAFGAPGRPRRIKPEAGIVGMGGRRLGAWRLRREEGFELDLGRTQRRHRARNDELAQLMLRLGHGQRQRRQQGSRHQHRLRTRMLQHVGIVVGGEEGVHRHRHDAGVHRAQKTHRPVAAVLHQQQHAFLALDAERLEPGGHPAHPQLEFAVVKNAGVVDERGPGSALRVAVQQVLRKVEALFGRRHGIHDSFGAHAGSPSVRWRVRRRVACKCRQLVANENMQYCASVNSLVTDPPCQAI